ncbi:MAG TPA: ribonuclease Z [Gemmatimonadaceae bacterium]|jgi:ribonuclease Z
MPLLLRFLGTSASRPTVERGVSAIAVEREGETLLFDCGEGTQRQMMRYGVSFTLRDIFFTHFHADHFLGLPGLLRTMALQGRTDAMHVWGPSGASRILKQAASLGAERPTFGLEIHELEPGSTVKRGEYAIVATAALHRGPTALTYAIVEDERRGRFNPERAREMGIPEGPLWGRIHKGETITLDDGRSVAPSALVGPTRTGRRIAITGDTRPCDATIEVARGADLLVHEATFTEEEAVRARETGHSTAREAAQVAQRAGVRRLVLTHLSARYTRDTSELEREAREIFPATTIARDGMEIDVPYADDTAAIDTTAAEAGRV